MMHFAFPSALAPFSPSKIKTRAVERFNAAKNNGAFIVRASHVIAIHRFRPISFTHS
jgi:hypothetical protein